MKPAVPQQTVMEQNVEGGESQTHEDVFDPSELPAGHTGRYLVTYQDIGGEAMRGYINNLTGMTVASTADFDGGALSEEDVRDADALIFEKLGVALVAAEPELVSNFESAVADNTSPILAVEAEEFVHALQEMPDEHHDPDSPEGFVDYLYGYRDAVDSIIGRISGSELEALYSDGGIEALASYSDTADLTWGLQATKASNSQCTGRGMRIAVLDTGFDLNHPDFVGRSPITASFVPGETVQDGHGHGTHCIGTASGPRNPADTQRRYGVATQSTILAGKVLNNAGSGVDAWILAGINWALQNNATIISMSLGSRVAPGQSYKSAYEQAAQAALNANCLVVAAAGNTANAPVGSPANCPSIMAVGAIDSNLQHASFSSIGINPNGGEVNIAAPGVGVYSSNRLPTKYSSWNGTSMATPHVAGCAALWAQNSGLRGQPLWNKLISSARNIGQTPQKVGEGLVQAPSCRRIVRPPWPTLPRPPYWKWWRRRWFNF